MSGHVLAGPFRPQNCPFTREDLDLTQYVVPHVTVKSVKVKQFACEPVVQARNHQQFRRCFEQGNANLTIG